MPIHSFPGYRSFILFCRAFGNERRVAMVVFAERHWRSVAEVAARFHITEQAASRHLAILKHAGILEGKREGKGVYFRLASHWSLEDIFRFNKRSTERLNVTKEPEMNI